MHTLIPGGSKRVNTNPRLQPLRNIRGCGQTGKNSLSNTQSHRQRREALPAQGA